MNRLQFILVLPDWYVSMKCVLCVCVFRFVSFRFVSFLAYELKTLTSIPSFLILELNYLLKNSDRDSDTNIQIFEYDTDTDTDTDMNTDRD
jgi:hypothetical protein